MPSIAEMLIKKGREEGREEGLEKGLEKGREEGVEETETKIVEKMVLKGISDADIRVIAGVSLVKIAAIRKRLKK